VEAVEIRFGGGPVILAMPHCGTWMPEEVLEQLNERGRTLADTDWHIGRLYDGLLDDVTFVRANFSRYLIDANRDPKDVSLYPGRNTTGLCPVTDFMGLPIWRTGLEPDAAEMARRTFEWHRPYHAALESEINRVRQTYGIAILYDCHSIRSQLPFLFDGRLPVFNVGSHDGRSCAPEIEKLVAEICGRAEGYDWVLNGRFKGGWTVRHHGRPHAGVHAIQMELAQAAYLETEAPPFDYSETKASKLRDRLKEILDGLSALARPLVR
jgi:N-formylglutamate deformylase